MKTKEKRQKKTAKQRAVIALRVLLIIVLVIALLAGACAIANTIANKSNNSFIADSVTAVEYENQLEPTIDENGFYTFVADRDFKVVQLTDVHIGTGFLSAKKDSMALNAVSSMLSAEKPDLVIVTGDIAYPVPFQAGTFNNKTSATMFADLMEKLGVYWCLTFGNHDTEAYSYFSREDIAKIYENREKYPHCLFQSGDESIDGVGNYAINVKNSNGEITQTFFMLDSHSYTDNDYFGIMWKYDCVHENQIEWYKNTVQALKAQNGGITPKSLAFMHIPVKEFQTAYYEYRDNGFKDTDNVKYVYGKAGEHNSVVYSSEHNYGLFDAFVSEGSTQGAFFGHDHLNNFSLIYNGIQLSYGLSIDYLAYNGISGYGSQRGCTIINCRQDGSFDCQLENYYQDKYQSINAKESVSMDDYHDDIDWVDPE